MYHTCRLTSSDPCNVNSECPWQASHHGCNYTQKCTGLALAFDWNVLGLGTEQQALHSAQVTAIWARKPKVDIIQGAFPLSIPLGSSNSQHALSLTIVLLSLSPAVISPLQH